MSSIRMKTCPAVPHDAQLLDEALSIPSISINFQPYVINIIGELP
jgi:hypothetical protein